MGGKAKKPITKPRKKVSKVGKVKPPTKPVAQAKAKSKTVPKTRGKFSHTSAKKRGASPRAGTKGKADPREIDYQMERTLENSAKRLMDMDKRAVAAVRTFQNSNGSVSGEMRVSIASNQSPDKVLYEMSVAAKALNRKGTWVQIGFVFAPRPGKRVEDEVWKLYNRQRGGGFRVGTFYRERDKLQYSFLTARTLLNTVKRRKRGSPTQVFMRMQWSPEGERPKKPVLNRKKRK